MQHQVIITAALAATTSKENTDAVEILHEGTSKPPVSRRQTPFENLLSESDAETLYETLHTIAAGSEVFSGAIPSDTCRVLNGVSLYREGRPNHRTGDVDPANDQTPHADVADALSSAVGGVSVCFVTGEKSSYIWLYNTPIKTDAWSKKLCILPAWTMTIIKGDDYHAGATFQTPNSILHAYIVHDFARFSAYIDLKGETVKEAFDIVMFHPDSLET